MSQYILQQLPSGDYALVNTDTGETERLVPAQEVKKGGGVGLSDVAKLEASRYGAKKAIAAASAKGAAGSGVEGIGPVASGAEYGSQIAGATPFYVPLAAAYGTYQGLKAAKQIAEGKAEKIQDVGASDIKKDPQGSYGRAQLAYSTMGMSELANMFLGGHKSTKQIEAEKRKALVESGVTGLQDFEAASAAAVTDGKPNIIRDPAKEGVHSPYDYVSSLGNYQTFGNDWDSYGLEDKAKITAAIDAEGLYDPEKGDVLITNPERAQEIKEGVLSGEIQVDPGENPYISNPEVEQPEVAVEGEKSEGGSGESAKPKGKVKLSLAQAKRMIPKMSIGMRYDLPYKNPYL